MRRQRVVGHDAVCGAHPALEQEGARDDADGAEGHHCACHHRVQVEAEGEEDAHGERDPEDVVHARPDEVAPDGAKDRAGEVERRHDVEQVRAHKDHIGRFDRHGCARGKRDADSCCGKRW